MRRIRQRAALRSIPVLVIAPAHSKSIASEAKLLGASGVVHRPLNLRAISQAVHSLLSRKRRIAG